LFSRKSEKKPAVVTLTPLIKETFKLLRSSIPTTIQMNLHLKTESDAVYADPSQIQQVIMNLCTNAAYAMRERKGDLRVILAPVEISTGDVLTGHYLFPGKYLKLTVSDTGCGIDPGSLGFVHRLRCL
jgi:signal transduction histidine kinase